MTGVQTCALPIYRRGKILIINGAEEYVEGKAKNALSPENVEKMAAAFHAWADVDRFARVVPVEEVIANDYNLNLTRYVQTAEAEAEIDVKAEYKKLQALTKERDAAEARMQAFMKELGY